MYVELYEYNAVVSIPAVIRYLSTSIILLKRRCLLPPPPLFFLFLKTTFTVTMALWWTENPTSLRLPH